MKKLFTVYCLLLSVLCLRAQKLTVDKFEVAVGDLSASVNQRNDLNGEACALVKVLMVDSINIAEGNVIGDIIDRGTEKWLYLTAGTKMMRIIPKHHLPLKIMFGDYGVSRLEGKVTYELTLVEPVDTLPVVAQSQAVAEQPLATQPLPDVEVETFTVKGVSFNMVHVKGGTFTMGAADGQGSEIKDDDKLAHEVMLSDYCIGETEVTQALWKAVIGYTMSNWRSSDLPVESVSWEDCQAFINKLNKLTGKAFRLPTEAEWEYAARGGKYNKNCKFAGSTSIDEVAWYKDNSADKTHAVKTKLPNELGIYDMSGNVWEWCQDWYGSYESGSKTNPSGPDSGDYRVGRGGSWFSKATNCCVTQRDFYNPSRGNGHIGFRLAL